MKMTRACLAVALMICSGASGVGYTWNNGDGDRDLANTTNWTPIASAFAAGDQLWVHEIGVIGSMTNDATGISPHLATVVAVTDFQFLVVGFGSTLGGGRVDIDAGGTLNIDHVVMGWDTTNPNNSTSILSLNGSNSTLNARLVQVGRGGDFGTGVGTDAYIINDGGTLNGSKLWVGNYSSGLAQVDLLAGDTFLSSTETDVLVIDTGANVDIEEGRLMLLGDRTSLVTSFLDGRLTGYGLSSNIHISTNAVPGWTEVTATPTPPLEIGDITLALLPGTNALTLTWATDHSVYTYTVESKISLLDASWSTNATGIAGILGGGDVTVTTVVDQAKTFYRVIGE